MGAFVTTAKSSEVNVLVPGASDDADLVCICFIDILGGLCLLKISIVCCKQSVTQRDHVKYSLHEAKYLFLTILSEMKREI